MINDKDTDTIEEALDISSPVREIVQVDIDNPTACLNCGFPKTKIESCLSKCLNCGNVEDCSDGVSPEFVNKQQE